MLKLVAEPTVHRQSYTLPPEWDTAIDRWTRWLQMTGLAPSSIGLRRSHLRFLARHTHTVRPADVDAYLVVDVLSNPSWSNAHRKSMRSSLVGFFDWCEAQSILPSNPTKGLPKVREDTPRPRPVTDDVWFDLLAKAAPRERLMALLAGEAGMRRAEVAVAHSDDLMHTATGYALIVHGKGNKQRVVPINDELAREFIDYCAGKKGHLFPGTDRWGNVVSEHMTPLHVGKLVAGLMPKGWTMHKLRHRYATMGHDGTGNIRAVQEALGHVSVATTQRYVATTSEQLRQVSQAAHKRK